MQYWLTGHQELRALGPVGLTSPDCLDLKVPCPTRNSCPFFIFYEKIFVD